MAYITWRRRYKYRKDPVSNRVEKGRVEKKSQAKN